MLTVIAFIVVLGPLILVHELGHFFGAKLTGVRVEEFGFGWPPRLWKFWQSPNRLKVGSSWIQTPRNFELPEDLKVGGYVDVVTRPEQDDEHVVQALRVLDRKADDLTPKREPAQEGLHLRGQVTELDLGTAYTLNWIPLGGFCRMTGEEDPSDPRSLAAQPKRERLAVLLGGPVMNLILATLLFSVSFLSGFPEPTETRVVILDVAPGSPAAEAGLQAGDFILKADSTPLSDVQDLQDYTETHEGQTVQLTLERDGKVLQQTIFVRRDPPPDQGRMGIKISRGIYDYVIRSPSLAEAMGMGVEQFWFSVKQMLQLPAMLIRGQVSPEEVRPVGPLGLSQLAGDAIERSSEQDSFFTVLHFAGAISMALGITNLLPLPALDGGRILFVFIEAIRGRRIDPAKEGVVHLIGMALLLGFMLIITIQELINPVASPF